MYRSSSSTKAYNQWADSVLVSVVVLQLEVNILCNS